MNNKEKFYAELKGVYAYLFEWKESIERNKNNYSKEEYQFQLDTLQSLRGQLKFFGNKAWEEIEKSALIYKENIETEEEQRNRVQKIVTFKNYTNNYYDDYLEVYDKLQDTKDPEEHEALNREIGFYLDAIKSSNYKFEKAIIDENRERIIDIVSVLDQTHVMSFDPFKIDHDRHIILKSKDELEAERDIILGMSDSAFDRFDQAKKKGIIDLLNKLYNSYISDALIMEEIEKEKQDVVVRKK